MSESKLPRGLATEVAAALGISDDVNGVEAVLRSIVIPALRSAEQPNNALEIADEIIENVSRAVLNNRPVSHDLLLNAYERLLRRKQAQDDILHFEAGWHCEVEAHVSSKAGFRTITLRDGGRTLKLRVSGAFAPKLKTEI